MNNCPCQLTSAEIQVLRMAAGDIPKEYGEWVDICAEFLFEAGYLTRMIDHDIGVYEVVLTRKGVQVYEGLDTTHNPDYNIV